MRIAACVLAALLAGCSTARPLRPLGAGGFAAEVSVPGVLVRGDGYTFPAGMVLIGGRYGLREDTELRLRLNVPILLKGIVGIEGGGVYHFRTAQGGLVPGLHFTADASVLTNPRFYGRRLSETVRGALAAAALADWEPLSWIHPYVVLDQALVLYDGAYVLSAFTGAQLVFGRFELSLETGVIGANRSTRSQTQPYAGVAGHGALWLSWGLAYRFGDSGDAP